jgi:hypothetical protein
MKSGNLNFLGQSGPVTGLLYLYVTVNVPVSKMREVSWLAEELLAAQD